MSYLIDSDWIADWLNGNTTATQLISALPSSGALHISIISYGEIYEGIYYSLNPTAAAQGFRRFLQAVTILPLSRRTMQVFARTRGQLRQGGNLIPDADLLIAATAMQHTLTLATRNKKHFSRIPGLILL
ncbi:MAG TPA: type II toxin-antitoxin system VapC family toxin [Chloroflexota bacterium]|nr:type II toxin-antitoxin system VapC family toxin [Chloroflexota bacterium]